MRAQIQLDALVADIDEAFHSTARRFSDYEGALSSSAVDPEIYEEMLEAETRELYIRIAFALEALELHDLLETFRAGFEEHRENLTAINVTSLGEPYPPALEYLRMYILPLRAAVGRPDDALDGLQQLERILLGTPKIVKDRGVEPRQESDVRNALYQMLLHIYPETVRDLPIAKVSKVYKPDIGIPSLKAAVEYKFATNESELKTAIGGVFEDVGGYAGSEDWKHFYAVFYSTDAFLTQAQVEAEFQLSKVDRSWKPILVFGKGSRQKRSGKKGNEKKGSSRGRG